MFRQLMRARARARASPGSESGIWYDVIDKGTVLFHTVAVAARKAYISERDFRVNKFKRPAVTRAEIDDEGVATARAIIANLMYEAPRDKWRNLIKCSSCSSTSFSLPLSLPIVVAARELMQIQMARFSIVVWRVTAKRTIRPFLNVLSTAFHPQTSHNRSPCFTWSIRKLTRTRIWQSLDARADKGPCISLRQGCRRSKGYKGLKISVKIRK